MPADNQANNKRVAKNTIVLYLRMVVIMLINLYISKVVLSTLGVDDYGIYNVVGGFVTLFSLLSGSLSNAISRYIAFELGKLNFEKLKVVFTSSVTVQIVISVVLVLFLESLGLWFLNDKMQIPLERMEAANWVLQCSIITFVLNLISIPYNACIIAHEKMTAFAYISIVEVLLKLSSALLLYLNFGDKLIVYAILLAFASLIVRLIYGIYCSSRFPECSFEFNYDRKIIREMLSLASWNILGSGASVLNNQGINVIINLFFGVTANAARGIAVQVQSAVTQFANSFSTAINPQITKKYAQGDFVELNKLVFRGARFSYYLMLLVTLPILVETPFILELWLKVVPEHTVIFVRLSLLISLVSIITTVLFTLSLATGDIKRYQIVIGCLALSIFGFSYIAYYWGADVQITYYIALIIEVAIMISRLIIVGNQVNFGIRNFFKEVLANILIVSFLSIIVPIICCYYWDDTIVFSLLRMIICLLSVSLVVFLVGMNKEERMWLQDIIYSKINSK